MPSALLPDQFVQVLLASAADYVATAIVVPHVEVPGSTFATKFAAKLSDLVGL